MKDEDKTKEQLIQELAESRQRIDKKTKILLSVFVPVVMFLGIMVTGTQVYLQDKNSKEQSAQQMEQFQHNIAQQRKQFQHNIEAKYFEMFLQDMNSEDPRRQSSAISMLSLLIEEGDFRAKLEKWIKLNSKKLLFSIPFKGLEDNETSKILETLPEEFKKRKIPLSDNAITSIQEKGKEWLITDNKQKYTIIAEIGKISIFSELFAGEVANKEAKSLLYKIYLHYTGTEKEKMNNLSEFLENKGYIIVAEYLMEIELLKNDIRYYYKEDRQEANSLKNAVLEFLESNNFPEIFIGVNNFSKNISNLDKVRKGTIELWIDF